MELSEIFEEIADNWRFVLIVTLLSGLIGVISFYLIPTKYIASGSLFISHDVDLVKRSEFTYEGSYARQTSEKYAETVIGLLESVDVRKRALDNLNGMPTQVTLRKAKKATRIKEAAPQLINLTVKGRSIDYAKALWSSLVQETILISDGINDTQGDSQLHISVVEGAPIVYEAYTNVFLNLGIGVFLGASLSVLFVALKEYLR
jgi:capsular polysaccharide biosynthesis protein